MHIVTQAVLLITGLAMLFPFFWMIATSFKTGREVFSLSLIPQNPTMENYQELFTNSNFPLWFLNSVLCGFIVTLSTLFFDSLVGYTFAKYRFRGKKLIFILILSTMMIPTEMLVIPWFIMSNDLGWANTYWGIIFPGMMSGFGTFLMRQFFDSVPNDLIDAGRIDGLNEFDIWRRICMPLVKPALSALAIFTFVGNWNAFLWPLIVINDIYKYTLPVGLSFFNGEFQTEWEMGRTPGEDRTVRPFSSSSVSRMGADANRR